MACDALFELTFITQMANKKYLDVNVKGYQAAKDVEKSQLILLFHHVGLI
jgi:hypothetical protein